MWWSSCASLPALAEPCPKADGAAPVTAATGNATAAKIVAIPFVEVLVSPPPMKATLPAINSPALIEINQSQREAAAHVSPGPAYEFEADFIGRGGREVDRVKSIGGVGGEEGQVRGVRLNDRAVSDLRRVADFSVTPFGGVKVEDGDVIVLTLMRMD